MHMKVFVNMHLCVTCILTTQDFLPFQVCEKNRILKLYNYETLLTHTSLQRII